ncbi:MAG: spore coat U domain-containing protein [Gammaproteobacteria bacterium]|nr:spore coat U domain-containing protein [Gammaproteobacteria bacterium]
MKLTKHLFTGAVALTGVALIGPAQAGTATGSLDVSATVEPLCLVSTTPVDFGIHTNSVNTAEGSIRVTCSPTVAYNIAMDGGLNVSNALERRMGDGLGNLIIYGLHKIGTWNDFWGDQDFAATTKGTSIAGVGTGVDELRIVYGYSNYSFLPMQVPGFYQDTVTVSVHY